MKFGLALSGGGFRATLFHLGVVKALLDRGVLKDVKHITSVSGGSILAAHLVQHWSEYTSPETFEKPARQIIAFARKDLRGRVLRRVAMPHSFALPYLKHLWQRRPRLRRDGTVRNLLFEQNLRALYGDVLLSDLESDYPDVPRLDILSTNLTQGSLAYFSNGSLVANDDDPEPVDTPISVARAVMVSALFPAIFPTVEMNAETLSVDPKQFPAPQYFTDGGVYDNLGIRRFQTVLKQEGCPIQEVLVSDASGAFNWLVESETLGQLKTALRSSDIIMKRLADLECELAGGRKTQLFTFLRISDVVKDNPALPETVQQQVKHIRTDLDAFSVREIRVLVKHGYEVAADATADWPNVSPAAQAWDPFPDAKPEAEARLVDQLRQSRFRKWGLFSARDWPSYVYPGLLLIAILFGIDQYRGERLHRFYLDQAGHSGKILQEVDADKAAALLERAVERPHHDQEHRLEAALLAYALVRQQKDELSERLFASATANLDPAHMARFHELKWKNFYDPLKRTTFGYPDCPDAQAALAFVTDVVNVLPPSSPVRVQAALTAYGVYSQAEDNDPAKQRAFDLLARVFEKPDRAAILALNDVDRFRVTLIEGHYHLTKGAAAQELGDTYLGDQRRADATEKYRQAEEHFQAAAATYESARKLRFTDLWVVHFNVCNATLNRAAALISYLGPRESKLAPDTTHVREVIKNNLGDAEKSCHAARIAAPTKWQPVFGLASVALKRGNQHREAANLFVQGFAIASEGGDTEKDAYKRGLADETNVKSLCSNARFSNTFPSTCRS